MSFTTVFEITRGNDGLWNELFVRLAIGVSALSFGVFGLIRAWRRRASWSAWLWALMTIAWALVWIVLHDFPMGFGYVADLAAAYRNHEYEVVEGDVVVLHRQPSTGHTKGDVVRIGGRTFEVNYFLATSAYHATIAHGGALKDGVHARIYHHNGAILRVDVREP